MVALKDIFYALYLATGGEPVVKPVMPEPTSTKVIWLQDLLKLFNGKFPGVRVYPSEMRYRLCHYDDIALFLAQDATNRYEYELDTYDPADPKAKPHYDCDDFARRLYGEFAIPGWADLTFGLVQTNLHALNCMVDEDLNIWFIEPQKDDIQAQLIPWQGSQLSFIIM